MASYLEGYRAGEANREKIYLRAAGILAALLALGVFLYFQFRDHREKAQIDVFVEDLKHKDYKSAYALWGCTDAHPCPQYSMDRFMEDWGPKSPHATVEGVKLGKEKSCEAGVIQYLEFPRSEEVQLWVERKSLTLGFAPWPVCNPRLPAR